MSEQMVDYMKWFRKIINIEGSVIFFFDHHKTQMTLELTKLCQELDIIPIGLSSAYTNFQPLNVGFFDELQSQFKFITDIWKNQPDNEEKSLEISDLAKLIKETNEALEPKETIQHAFWKCGIYPWNVDNILERSFERRSTE